MMSAVDGSSSQALHGEYVDIHDLFNSTVYNIYNWNSLWFICKHGIEMGIPLIIQRVYTGQSI